MPYTYLNYDYRPFIKAADEESKKTIQDINLYRNNDILSNIGVSTSFWKQYVEQIVKEFPDFTNDMSEGKYDEVMTNYNKIGKPELIYSIDLNIALSPNCARYLYHALVANQYIRSKCPDQPVDIVHIGDSVAGVAFWMRVLNPQIKEMTMVDLPPVLNLQQTILDYLGVKASYCGIPVTYAKGENPTFVFSNYAFSEFNEVNQALLAHTIVQKADHGFFTWNNWSGVYPFITDKEMTIEPERPAFANIPNKFVFF